MKREIKPKTAKEIALLFRFSETKKQSREEILVKYEGLYFTCLDLCALLLAKDERIKELERINRKYQSIADSKPKYSEYDPSWGGIEKVVYILKENAKALLSTEIETILLEIQPRLKEDWDNTRIASATYITRAVKAGRLMKYKNGNKFVYGLPEWFDEFGKPFRKFII